MKIFRRNLELYSTQLCKNPVLKHFSNFSIDRLNVSFVKKFGLDLCDFRYFWDTLDHMKNTKEAIRHLK